MAACKIVVGVIAVFCFSLYGVDGQDSDLIEFSHTCAVLCSDKISCGGDNRIGQLGSNNINLTENQIEMRDVKQITAGASQTCALKNDGSVSCWGWNIVGQLGNSFNSGKETANPNPLDVNILNVKQMTAGYAHTCALKNDGSVFCWGLKFPFGNAEIGPVEFDNPTIATFTPEETAITQNNNVAGNVIEVTADLGWTCLLYDTKEIYCMGAYNVKNLDDPNRNFTVQPDRKNLYYKTATDAAFLADSVGENACSTNDDDDDTKLSIPVIVGIVAGAVLLFGGIAYYCLKRSAKGYEYVLNK